MISPRHGMELIWDSFILIAMNTTKNENSYLADVAYGKGRETPYPLYVKGAVQIHTVNLGGGFRHRLRRLLAL